MSRLSSALSEAPVELGDELSRASPIHRDLEPLLEVALQVSLHVLLGHSARGRRCLELHADVEFRLRLRLRDWLQQSLQNDAELPVIETVAEEYPAAVGKLGDDVRRNDLHLIASETHVLRHKIVFRQRNVLQ